MYPYIYKYFILNKKLSLPGIGCLIIENCKATFNDNKNAILPPNPTINFSTTTTLADKSFYHFLATELHIEEVDAIKNFHDFSYQLQNGINKANGIVLPGIGTIKKHPSGSLEFETEVDANQYLSEINLSGNKKKTTAAIVAEQQHIFTPPIIDEVNSEDGNNSTQKQTKDYWWIFAILLALIGIVAIYYKLF
ncbi:MAG TPA: hypothetical protein PKG56_05620 [Chitinophagaceae bacterium]|nr:hypothetical protein [Chitinophagaceae bacterium]HMZ46905.1 hypothetical protein [Chitinophagaceae bacterium]HNL82853.1 hypothetical protein [Chitinophagaceae bacterium]HNM34657.1 hypothetical protein [Chitinophagaceae bacterium]HNN30633.1 hypothetical protein [Chitinophagaceae bacterium]